MSGSPFPSRRIGKRRAEPRCGGALRGALRHALSALVAWQAIVYCAGVAAEPEVFRIDPGLTRAEFSVDHFWVTTLRGRFGRASGTIVLDSAGRAGTIDFTIDADSVDTGWTFRDDFIRSEHMIDASRFPTMRFRATQLAFDHAGLAGASGELTMHNVTRPVAVKVERMQCASERQGGGDRCGVSVVSSIKRSDFGMTFGLPFVGDDIDLSFHLTAHRVAP
jgi:polyisoprenoid-binding protein YceI